MKLPRTLSELKRLNSESETTDEHETEILEEEEQDTAEQQEPLEGAELVDQNEAEDVPAWLQTGEEEETSSEDDVKVPLSAHIAQRKKFQGNINGLRTDIETKDSQIEALSQTIQELRDAIQPKTGTKAAADVELPPVLSDFEEEDNPEIAHQKAILDWSMRTFEKRQQQTEARKKQAHMSQQREQELTRHYERAGALIEAGQLTPDEYRSADAFVRQAIEMTRPGEGKTIFNTLFADLGKGSEKVLISLYRNSANLSQLQQELTSDQTGIRASMFLGRLAADFERTSSRTTISSAPKPGSKVSGTGKRTTNTSERKLRKAYDDAHKRGDFQGAFAAKKQAKAGGVDVSRWAYD